MLNRTIAPIHSGFINIDFPKVTSQRLINGIPLHTLHSGIQPVVKVEVVFNKGGMYYEHKPSVALMALQMLAEGTASYKSSEISNHFAQYGAFYEVSPSFDVSSISLYCLTKHLDKVLPYFMEVITSPSFPENELALQKNMQVQQLNIQHEKTNIVAAKKFREMIFGKNYPYGKITEVKDITAITSEDLRKFHADNLAEFELILCGDIEGTVKKHIANTFTTSINRAAVPSIARHHPLPKKMAGKTLTVSKENAVQSSLRIGRTIINKSHKDYIPLLITNHLLGGYFGSRLMKNIREDKGLTYGIHSSIVSLIEHAYFVISSDVKKENTDLTLTEIKKELTLLCEHKVLSEELNTVKSHLLGQFQSHLDSPFSLTELFKNVHFHKMDYSYYDRYIATITTISPDDIQRMATTYLAPNMMNEVVAG